MLKRVGLGILFLILFLIGSKNVAAQEGIARWLRYDVNLTVQQNSGLSVEEIHEVALVSGANTFTRIIPADQLDAINNIQISEVNPSSGQRGYQQADSQTEYTFQLIQQSDDELALVLYFPPNNVTSTRFIIRYFVVG